MTTQNLLTEWLESYQKEHTKARTYSRYQGLITMHIVPTLGKRNIAELGRREIQEFLTQQKKDGNMRNGEKLSATSTNMMLSILNLAFEYIELTFPEYDVRFIAINDNYITADQYKFRSSLLYRSTVCHTKTLHNICIS